MVGHGVATWRVHSGRLASAPVVDGKRQGDDALGTELPRPAPVDAALLVAVHRGLQAVAADASGNGAARQPEPEHPGTGGLVRRRRG